MVQLGIYLLVYFYWDVAGDFFNSYHCKKSNDKIPIRATLQSTLNCIPCTIEELTIIIDFIQFQYIYNIRIYIFQNNIKNETNYLQDVHEDCFYTEQNTTIQGQIYLCSLFKLTNKILFR